MKWDAKFENGILELSHFWGDEAGAVVRVDTNGISLFEVPQYGGEEMFVGKYDSVLDALNVAEKWT